MDAPGTRHRNHCPTCLWSRHLDDDVPGDRAADCAGSMEPIAVCVRADGEWALVHRCGGCDTVRLNRIAGDDNPLSLHAPGGPPAGTAAVPHGVAEPQHLDADGRPALAGCPDPR
jgi:hypothetical protein